MRWMLAVAVAVAVLATGCVVTSQDPAPSTGSTGSCGASSCPPHTFSQASTTAMPPHLVMGDPSSSGLDAWPEQFDMAPAVADLDGDGRAELVVQSHDEHVYVFSADGAVLAHLPTTYPDGWGIDHILNGVSIGVLAPGEPPSLVVADSAAYITVWRPSPQQLPGALRFDRVWEHRMDACYWNPGMDARPTLADLDGDGYPEILVQTEEIGFFALRGNGTTLWQQCWAGGNSAPIAGDLDGDGRPEYVVASDDGLVSVLDGKSGHPLWSFDAARYVKPGAISVEPVIADLDGQGEKEVLFTARCVPEADPATWPGDHMGIFAIHRNEATWQSELVWMRQPDWANPISYTHLAVLDVDHDGLMDIFGMDWNTVGHFPGNWERIGPAHAFRLDAQGNDVWVRTFDTWWSNKDIAIGDVDGDGQAEVLVNAPDAAGDDGIVALDPATGQKEHELGVPGWQVMRGVVLTDLRGDGRMQAVFPVAPTAGPTHGALLVFELDVPFSAPYPGGPPT